MATSRFEIKFDGAAVSQGLIEVRDFAPAALAAGELVERANEILNGERAAVSVRLRTDSFSVGSCETVVHITLTALDQAKNPLLEGGLKDAHELLGALGFWINAVAVPTGGLIYVIRRLNGKKPKSALEHSDRIALEVDDGDVMPSCHSVLDVLVPRGCSDVGVLPL